MDLGTVKKKLNNNLYETVEICLTDIQLVWDNCKTYNTPENVLLSPYSGSTSKPTSSRRWPRR
jgi:hypothetical protein